MAAIIAAKSTSRSTDCFNTHACHLGPRPASRASNCCVFSAGTATFDPDSNSYRGWVRLACLIGG
jgi:hypothetical protein